MIVPTDRFVPAPMDVDVVDVWPPGTFDTCARDAYDALVGAKRIRPVSVTRDGAGRMIVRYRADIPAPWIHEELREAKLKGIQLGIEVKPT